MPPPAFALTRAEQLVAPGGRFLALTIFSPEATQPGGKGACSVATGLTHKPKGHVGRTSYYPITPEALLQQNKLLNKGS